MGYKHTLETKQRRKTAIPRGKSEEVAAHVRRWAGLGFSVMEIAEMCGVTDTLIYRHYGSDFRMGRIEANKNVASTLYDVAVGYTKPDGTVVEPDKGALIYWTKARMGWSDTLRIEHTGAEGGDLRVTTEVKATVGLSPAVEAVLTTLGMAPQEIKEISQVGVIDIDTDPDYMPGDKLTSSAFDHNDPDYMPEPGSKLS